MDPEIFNSFFDKIYVLTLQRATDRHEKFKKELSGLNYSIFYGKDKADFDIAELKEKNIYNEALAIKHERHGHPLSPGMIGCSWSHKLIYEDIIANNFEKVMILEDDIVINQNNMKLVPQILNDLPKDWELLYFGFAKNEIAPPLGAFKKYFYHFIKIFNGINYSHKTINNLYPRKVSEHLYTSGYHDCTHAYAITLSGAKKLLQLQTPISFFPDNLLAHAATNEIIKAFITVPKIIDQEYQIGRSSHSYVNH